MKKQNAIFVYFSILFALFFLPALSQAKPCPTYNSVVFFGDSLTDNGNLYKIFGNALPKSPPYFEGRFSNGQTWSDRVADRYHTMNIPTENYAIGGETAIYHDPAGGFFPFNLPTSLQDYYSKTEFKDTAHTLFIIWIGANDYLNGSTDVDKDTSAVIEGIQSTVESLITHGAKNILLLNLPDLGKIPYSAQNKIEANLTELSTLHNEKLDKLFAQLKAHHLKINLHRYDISDVFNTVITHPEKINRKYHLHLSNTSTACWQGGYTVTRIKNQKELIEASLGKENLSLDSVKQKQLSSYIAGSPALAAAYDVSESYLRGGVPCSEPETYVFWDFVHPTATVHSVLASLLTDYIEDKYRRG